MESQFLSAIRQSLSEWAALQLAIEHGMGGDQAVADQMRQMCVDEPEVGAGSGSGSGLSDRIRGSAVPSSRDEDTMRSGPETDVDAQDDGWTVVGRKKRGGK